jgi:hypothetical protein
MAEGVQSGPEQSRARSLRRQRTLDGEDRSVTIPPRRKGSGRSRFFGLSSVPLFCAQSSPVATLPSALLVSDLFRSVQVGCSRCSRCCHLFVDLRSISRWKLGQAIDAVTGTRRWGAVLPTQPIRTMRLPAVASLGCCAVVRRPLRSPTSDAARPRAFVRSRSPLVSSHSSRRARPASNPSAADRCPLQTAPECGAPPAPAGFVLLYLLRLERVDNLGAYRIPPETGILIPSVRNSYRSQD